MIRFTKALVAAAALLVLPSVASAISIQIINVDESYANDGFLEAGEEITFDLRMTDNVGGPNIFGLAAGVTGYDLPSVAADREFGIALVGGDVVSQSLGLDVGGGPPGLFGIDNILGTATENFVVNHLNPQAFTTALFEGVGTNAAAGDGTDDLGIGGNPIASDLHFQVTFSNVGGPAAPDVATAVTLNFNTFAVLDGGASETNSTPYVLTVVPEPGTALLMGLGLAGLATTRRR